MHSLNAYIMYGEIYENQNKHSCRRWCAQLWFCNKSIAAKAAYSCEPIVTRTEAIRLFNVMVAVPQTLS